MITKKEVKHIAKLARLGLTETEIKKMEKELSKILDYIEKLKKVDISKIESINYSFKRENVMREDIEKLETKNQKSKRLLELAPETEDGYLKVKSIL